MSTPVRILTVDTDATLDQTLARLKDLAAQMRGQDNACTAHPMFVVQQRRRIHGIDPSYSDLFEWIDNEGRTADAEEHDRLEAAYQQDEDDDEGERQFWTRAHYVDSWENVQPFFSRSGAEDYIARNRHNLTDPRVYVDSAHRNSEWQLVRALLLALLDSPRRTDGCEGFGRCHGTMRWCDACGDVSSVCDDVGCDRHRQGGAL